MASYFFLTEVYAVNIIKQKRPNRLQLRPLLFFFSPVFRIEGYYSGSLPMYRDA